MQNIQVVKTLYSDNYAKMKINSIKTFNWNI